MPVTSTNTQFRIFVDDIAGIIALYNRIQVFRSIGDQFGPWEQIAGVVGPASIQGYDETEPFALNGKTLELRLNGAVTATIVFSGLDPYPAGIAIADINAILGPLGLATSPVGTGQVKITTAATGTDASIEVSGGSGYPNLGFQATSYGIGSDAAISLVAGQQDYTYIDHNGSINYWYRTRFWNSVSGALSEYSVPFPASKIQQMPSTDLITGTCHLVDLKGNALADQEIHIFNLFEPTQRSGYTIFGMDEYFKTDQYGYAEIKLVRGSLVEVAWVGTAVRRRIRVPTAGSSFDLLDASLADDNFGIHVPDIRLCERRFP